MTLPAIALPTLGGAAYENHDAHAGWSNWLWSLQGAPEATDLESFPRCGGKTDIDPLRWLKLVRERILAPVNKLQLFATRGRLHVAVLVCFVERLKGSARDRLGRERPVRSTRPSYRMTERVNCRSHPVKAAAYRGSGGDRALGWLPVPWQQLV